jgi:hypothetical protein
MSDKHFAFESHVHEFLECRQMAVTDFLNEHGFALSENIFDLSENTGNGLYIMEVSLKTAINSMQVHRHFPSTLNIHKLLISFAKLIYCILISLERVAPITTSRRMAKSKNSF